MAPSLEDTQALRIRAEATEKALQDRVEREEQILFEFERELLDVRAEREAFEEKREVYDALGSACGAIDKLTELDAANLFWQAEAGQGSADTHLSHARRNLAEFEEQVRQLEERRAEVREKIDTQNDLLDDLHYQLRDAIEVAETRRDEWELERDPSLLPYRPQVMPWARGFEEDKRFWRSLAATCAACAILAFVMSIVDLPILERSEVNAVPERVAKLVRKELPPPPPAEPQPVNPEPEPEEVPPEEPQLAEEVPPEPTPEVVEPPEVAENATAPTPQTTPEPVDTREQVKSKGILAFSDSFASRANAGTTAQLGAQARISNAGESAVGRPERLMVTTTAPGSSGGINLADISRDVGGGGGGDAIKGVQVTRVASSIGGAEGPDRPLSAGAAAGRTDEEIQIVFDRYKAALYRLYNRELRKNPTLRGQLVLKLTIEPDGSVSMCQLQSSDMDAPALADEVVSRVRTFDFGAKEDIVAMTIIYPIDFLPTA